MVFLAYAVTAYAVPGVRPPIEQLYPLASRAVVAETVHVLVSPPATAFT